MPLHGKTILTTRAGSGAGDLGSRLRALGASVIECPAIEIAPVEDWHDVDRAIASLDSYQWLLFTSANAVNAFMERVRRLTRDALQIPVAVVGPTTAASLARWDVQARLVPADFRAEGLLAALPDRMDGTRILFPRAEVARELLPDELRQRGAIVDVVVVYRTVRGAGMEDVPALLEREPVHCIAFTSSSTVRYFAEALGEDTRLLDSVPLAVIGPVTRSAAEGLGFKVSIEPARSTAADLAEAINAYFEAHP